MSAGVAGRTKEWITTQKYKPWSIDAISPIYRFCFRAGTVSMYQFQYDVLRRLVSTASQAYSLSCEHYRYDWKRRVTQKKVNTSTSDTVAPLYQENYSYTGLAGNIRQVQKTVLGTSSTDPSIVTTQRFDLLGRMVEETIGSNTYTYSYNNIGQLTRQTDGDVTKTLGINKIW